MVSLLAAVSGATGIPERDSLDADFGVPYEVAGDERLTAGLADRDYTIAGAANRFSRTDAARRTLIIDVLAPSYSSRLQTNRAHGELVLDEIPGLSYALAVAPVAAELDITLSDAQLLTFTVLLPTPVAALSVKAFGYAGRAEAKDALDIWRLLEAARALDVTASSWASVGTPAQARELLIERFGTAEADGTRAVSADPHIPTRVAALVAAVCGTIAS
jgi:hypothetical protein